MSNNYAARLKIRTQQLSGHVFRCSVDDVRWGQHAVVDFSAQTEVRELQGVGEGGGNNISLQNGA